MDHRFSVSGCDGSSLVGRWPRWTIASSLVGRWLRWTIASSLVGRWLRWTIASSLVGRWLPWTITSLSVAAMDHRFSIEWLRWTIASRSVTAMDNRFSAVIAKKKGICLLRHCPRRVVRRHAFFILFSTIDEILVHGLIATI